MSTAALPMAPGALDGSAASNPLPMAPGAFDGMGIDPFMVPMAMHGKQAPGLDSISDIERFARPKISIYYAGDEPDMVEVAGHYYSFMPKSASMIEDQYTYPMMQTPTGQKPNFAMRELSMSSVDVTKALLEDRSEKGYCVLYGDGRDGERMAMARQKYVAWRYAQAKRVQASWLTSVAKATDGGGIAPVQTKRVRDEIMWLRQHEMGLIDRQRYVCRIDGFEAANRDEVVRYIKSMYPTQDAESNVQDLGDMASQAPAPVEPKPRVSPEGQRLIDVAQAQGLALSVADKKGLTYGDGDVITDVRSRLSALEPAQQDITAKAGKRA